MILESQNVDKYLNENIYVDFSNELIVNLINSLFYKDMDEISKIQVAFEYVRDKIYHSADIQSDIISRTASETLKNKEGICYAKSMLLSAILRSQDIPTGFCYQRLTLGDTPDTGYCIHALNAVYISFLDRWIRLDARGNTNGINAQFSIDKEKLAFPIRKNYDEIDYPTVYFNPIKVTTDCLENNSSCIEMMKHKLPTKL